MSIRSGRSNGLGMIVLGLCFLGLGLSLNPGFRPAGFVPSIWPYFIFLSGAALILIGLFYFIRNVLRT